MVMDKKTKSGESITKSSKEHHLHHRTKGAGQNSIELSRKRYIRIRPTDTCLSWAASWIADTNPIMYSRLRDQGQANASSPAAALQPLVNHSSNDVPRGK